MNLETTQALIGADRSAAQWLGFELVDAQMPACFEPSIDLFVQEVGRLWEIQGPQRWQSDLYALG